MTKTARVKARCAQICEKKCVMGHMADTIESAIIATTMPTVTAIVMATKKDGKTPKWTLAVNTVGLVIAEVGMSKCFKGMPHSVPLINYFNQSGII